MKLLLYCTKAKPYLLRDKENKAIFLGITSRADRPNYDTEYGMNCDYERECCEDLNGKIVAECDYEVEEIIHPNNCISYYCKSTLLKEKSCLTDGQIYSYLKDKNGYAIHIKNLHIFDEPKELSEYYGLIPKKVNTLTGSYYINVSIDKAPQNMMYAIDDNDKEYVLISIRPEWLCKILNGEKTIEVRKKVLKEMLRNGKEKDYRKA